MRLLKLALLGVVGSLLLTVGIVRYDDIAYKISSKVTDAEAQDIYGEVVRATGQGGIVPPLTISNQGIVNAYTTSEGVVLYRGLLEKLNKDEIALVLGHEVSHFVLGHVSFNAPLTVAQIRIDEMQADKYGAVLMMRAGYNICEGRKFFLILNMLYGDNMDQDHPDFAFRYDQLNINCGR